jgi:hypothetical protein
MSKGTRKRLSTVSKFGMTLGTLVVVGFLLSISGVLGDFVQNISLRTNTQLENGLVAYWSFDGTTATSTVSDLSGNNRTLTNKDFVKLLTDNTQGTTTYTVPSDTTLVFAKLWGAGGGGGVMSGGNGGYARGQFGVSPGESITYEVGDGSFSGGGASTIKRNSTYLIIAGAGGAGGGNSGSCGGGGEITYTGFGGAGGGLVGDAGTNGGCTDDFTDTSQGGGGGSQSSGGFSGGGLGSGTDGGAGVANAGGNGANSGTCGTSATGCGGSTNGGGGGYFGGGGGEGSNGSDGDAGGGGGSSFHNNSFVVASSTLSGLEWPTSNDPDRGTAGNGGIPGIDGAVVLYGHQQATTTTVAGRIGQGASFRINTATTSAGTSTLLSSSSTSGVVQNTGVATVAFWVKTDDFSTSVYQTPLNISRGITDQTPRLQVQLVGTSTSQGVIRISARAGDTEAIQYATTTSKGLDEGKWHHVVAVVNYASDSTTIYIDGSATSTAGTLSFTAAATSNTAPKAVELGRSATTTLSNFNDPLVGTLDDVRIYNQEPTSSEILRLYQIGATTRVNAPTATNTSLSSGLVTHWTFDGPRLLQNVTDSSSTGNTGYLRRFTATTTLIGKLGQALSFSGWNGLNEYVVGSQVINLSTVSISAWVRISEVSIFNGHIAGLMDGLQSGATNKNLFIGTDGKIYFYIYDGTGKTTSAPASVIPLNTWVHVVGTADGTNAKTYMNGAEVGTVAAGAPADTFSVPNFFVNGATGIPSTNGYFVDADIDDVRFYNRALSASEANQLYQIGASTQANVPIATNESLSSSLVGHWTFDGSRLLQNVTDSSGAGNNAFLTSGFTSTTTAPGKFGQALSFDGSNDYVRIPSFSHNIGTGDFTFSAWVYPRRVTTNYEGVMSVGSFAPNMTVDSGATNQWGGFWGSGLASGSVLSTNTWYFLVMQREGTTVRFYRNGVVEPTTHTVSTSMSNTTFQIGANGTGTGLCDCIIDEVRVYTRALSAAEIMRLYQLGSTSGFIPSHIANVGNESNPRTLGIGIAILQESSRRLRVKASIRLKA